MPSLLQLRGEQRQRLIATIFQKHTCNLQGMPGVFGGLVAAALVAAPSILASKK